jgi:hypothetical protein
MLLKPLTFAAAGLSVASAFLLPPELSESAAELLGAPPFLHPGLLNAAESQVVKVDCPGCPVRDSFGDLSIGTPNYLELAFGIDHLPTNDRLVLNGFELYPHPDPIHFTLTAPQVAVPPEEFRGKTAPRLPRWRQLPRPDGVVPTELGFGLEAFPLPTDDKDGLELINVNLQITQVANTIVDGIRNINIRLIKAPNGALIIAGIQETESVSAGSREECTSILCRWKAAVSEQMQRMRGHKCHMSKPGKVQKHGRPHHAHNHGSEKSFIEVHEHSWEQLFKSFNNHILWPVLVGIAAGVSVSM